MFCSFSSKTFPTLFPQFPHSFRRIAGNFHARKSGKITVFFAVLGPMEIPLIEHTLNSILAFFTVYAILWNCLNCTNSLKYPRGKKTMCPVNFKRLFASKVEVQWRFWKRLFCKFHESTKKKTSLKSFVVRNGSTADDFKRFS